MLAIPAGFAGRYASDRVLVALGMASLALGGALARDGRRLRRAGGGPPARGAGFVLCSIYFTKMVADWFAGRELATAMAILVMSWPFGIAMGQVGHGWLEATQGWRAPFVVASLYCLAGAIAVLVAYRPPRSTAPWRPRAPSARLTSREWTLTLIAALAWARSMRAT